MTASYLTFRDEFTAISILFRNMAGTDNAWKESQADHPALLAQRLWDIHNTLLQMDLAALEDYEAWYMAKAFSYLNLLCGRIFYGHEQDGLIGNFLGDEILQTVMDMVPAEPANSTPERRTEVQMALGLS